VVGDGDVVPFEQAWDVAQPVCADPRGRVSRGARIDFLAASLSPSMPFGKYFSSFDRS